MKRILGTLTLAVVALVIPARAQQSESQETSELERIEWEHGPGLVRVGEQATMNLPQGFVFTQAAGTKTFLEATQNLSHGDEVGILAPEDLSWFAIVSFDDIGYVKDDEKDSLDAEVLLTSIRQSTEESNKERSRRGWGRLSVIGWARTPRYDSRTHNLEWSVKGQDEKGEVAVNHFTRLLGRRGVTIVDFVTGMETYETQLVSFQQAMDGFHYTQHNDYLAFIAGDKVAAVGLTGLIVGRTTVVAAEGSLFRYLWKLILAVLAGICAFMKKLSSLLRKLFSPRPHEALAQPRL